MSLSFLHCSLNTLFKDLCMLLYEHLVFSSNYSTAFCDVRTSHFSHHLPWPWTPKLLNSLLSQRIASYMSSYGPVHEFSSAGLLGHGSLAYLILYGIDTLLAKCTPWAKIYWAPTIARRDSSHRGFTCEQSSCFQWVSSQMQETAMNH